MMPFDATLGPAPTINTSQLKNTVFEAIPTSWQQQFLHVGSVANMMLLNLQNFLEAEREFQDHVHLGTNPTGTQQINRENNRESMHDNMNHDRRQDHMTEITRPNKHTIKNQCPLHPNHPHSWFDCRQNPRS